MCAAMRTIWSVAIVLGVAIAFWLMRKRHVEEEVVEVLASGDTVRDPKADASRRHAMNRSHGGVSR